MPRHRRLLCALTLFLGTQPAIGQVLRFSDLTTDEVAKLDRARTVVILPGATLEEHGPYLPNGTDGIFSERLAEDLAMEIESRPAWSALMLPSVPLGAGGANEIGGRYGFPGTLTIRPTTLRSVLMDLADQLAAHGFRWILVVHGHGDPAHNRMIDEAGDYFRDTYAGAMVNVLGHVWAMPAEDLRSAEDRALDGLAEHATMTETSVVLALRPDAVRAGFRAAAPQTGRSMEELQRIAAKPDWPGYFGAPGRATPELGARIYASWLARAREVVTRMLAGESLASLPRLGTIYADDPADAAAVLVHDETERRQAAWLSRRHAPAAPPR